MDKQPNKIVVKINGKEKDHKAEEPLKLVGPQPQYEQDVQENKPERIEKSEDEFSWILPNYESQKVVPIEDLRNVKGKQFLSTKKQAPRFSRKKGGIGVFKKIAFIVSGAVLIGTGLGMVSVKMMTGKDSFLTSVPVEEAGTPRLEEEPVKETPATEQPPSNDSGAAVEIPGFEVFVVQAGVFSAKSGSEQAAEGMKGKGYSALALRNSESYSLFIGIGTREEDVKALAEYYKKKNETTYVKLYNVPKHSFTSLTKSEEEVLKKGRVIYEQLLSLSSKAVAQSIQPDGVLLDIKNELIKLKAEKVKDEQIDSFITRMFMTAEVLDAYTKSKQEQDALQSQQYLLDALATYIDIK